MTTKFAFGAIAWVMCASLAAAAPVGATQAPAAPVGATQTPAAPVGATQAPAAPAGVDLSKLPAPVRATIEAETRNATLKHVGKEIEKGRTHYEVETIVNGHSRDLLVDPSGKLLEVEEAIPLESAPAAVQDALKARGKVLKLETVQRGGTTTYEAHVQGKSGTKSSVAIDGQGRPVKR